jgi:transposase InsO family protein
MAVGVCRLRCEAKGSSWGATGCAASCAHGLRATWKRKFIHTTDSRHSLPTAANVLDRQFQPAGPNQAWVSDITYLRTRSGWLYLAAVMDLFSRKIVGWAMAPTMPAELVCSALQMAITQRSPSPV